MPNPNPNSSISFYTVSPFSSSEKSKTTANLTTPRASHLAKHTRRPVTKPDAKIAIFLQCINQGNIDGSFDKFYDTIKSNNLQDDIKESFFTGKIPVSHYHHLLYLIKYLLTKVTDKDKYTLSSNEKTNIKGFVFVIRILLPKYMHTDTKIDKRIIEQEQDLENIHKSLTELHKELSLIDSTNITGGTRKYNKRNALTKHYRMKRRRRITQNKKKYHKK